MNRSFTLLKPEWDVIALERVQEACDITKKADVAAVVCQEGLANVCLMTSSMTIIRQHIDCPVPRKRKGSVTNYEKVRVFCPLKASVVRTEAYLHTIDLT